ncbi:hypothetical protein LUZ60_000716 [Juncus effusus]|nr:hypothetical protein LUZ60_000716 [Juncus effusus]
MSYSNTAFIKCIVAIVKSFNWRQVIAVYQDDGHITISNTALLFSFALREVGSELEYVAAFAPARNGSFPKSSVQDELIRMQKQLSTVYVVLHSSEALALSLFHEATELGMMEKGENERGLHGFDLNNPTVVFWPGGPTTIPGGLRKLKVGIPANPVWENFEMVEVDMESRRVTNRRGFCVDVFLAILDRMKYKFEYEYVPFNFGINSSLDYEFRPIPEGTNSNYHFTYDDLVDQVYLKKVDLVVGDVTILAPRSEKVSFTQPFLSSGIVMLVPLEDDNPRWLLLSPFKWTLWLAIFGMMLCTFVAILVLEKYGNQPHGDFQGPCDSRISCSGFGFVLNYLKDVLHYKQEIILATNSSDYPNAFQNGTITAAFLEVPYVRVFLSKYKGYTVYGETHMLGGFGFVLPKFSTMTFDMSKAILELQEDGTLKKIEDKWFSVTFKPAVSPMDNTNKQKLEFDNFSSLFIFSMFVSGIALVIFLIRKINLIQLLRLKMMGAGFVSEDNAQGG